MKIGPRSIETYQDIPWFVKMCFYFFLKYISGTKKYNKNGNRKQLQMLIVTYSDKYILYAFIHYIRTLIKFLREEIF